MKYALTTDRGMVIHVLNTALENTVEITDEQAQTVADGLSQAPKVFYILENGELTEFRQWREAQRPPPAAVTPRQLRLALLSQGITGEHIAEVIAGLPEGQREAARIEWEYALEIRRDHPLVAGFAAALGKSGEEIGALFRAAGRL